MRRSSLSIVTATAVVLATLFIGAPVLTPREAHAVVGRPATPVSYAGVARRTTRRTVATTAAVSSAAMMTSLPAGCATSSPGGVVHYQCSGSWYRPYYQGSTVVYQSVGAP